MNVDVMMMDKAEALNHTPRDDPPPVPLRSHTATVTSYLCPLGRICLLRGV